MKLAQDFFQCVLIDMGRRMNKVIIKKTPDFHVFRIAMVWENNNEA